MGITTESIVFVSAVLLFLSIIAGKTGYRFGMPTLLFFLVVGIFAGSEGPNWFLQISFNNYNTAQFIGIVALNFILFSGGLSTKWQETKPIFLQGLSLATIGVILTAGITGCLFYYLGVFIPSFPQFSFLESLLFGAIVSSTDAAAVFSVLRSKKLGLKNNLKPLLEFESGSNDPMAYILTITCISLITAARVDLGNTIIRFITQLILGLGFGFGWGRLSQHIMNHIKLDYEGLYFVLVIAIMFFSFSIAHIIGGNGFLSVYITGLTLGNLNFMHRNSVLKVFDGFAWLMQIVLFLTLGLLVVPSQLKMLIGVGLIISLFVIIFARPFAVFTSLVFFKLKKMSIIDRLFVSWVGLKGAVPIVFATYPMIEANFNPYVSQTIFNLVFFISSISLIVQGTTIPLVAKFLKVDEPMEDEVGILERFIDDDKTVLKEVKITKKSIVIDRALHELDLPKNIIIAMISRNKKFIIPDGATKLLENDRIKILAEDKESMEAAMKFFE
ncbi:MAG: potassium/proton antiporter [Candidatus Cloacimonetes bacterium]|nr:potassium/proton antiporter [Candidatus Cloacimonadota bacterium]